MIVIAGGGITGLAAAHELALRGVPFALLEAASSAGGLIRTERIGGFILDAGPDSLLVQKPAAIRLCDELGLGGRLMGTTPPRTAFVLKHGQLHALPSPSVLGLPTSWRALARYDLLTWPARARLALEPLLPRVPVEDESVGSFFRRRFGAETVHLIAEPLLGGIHAGDVEDLSVASLFPRLVDAERHGGVLRTLAPSGVARSGGLFRALRSGMGELVDAVLARLPAGSVALDTAVERMARVSAAWQVTAGDRTIDAAAIILTLPAYAAARVFADVDDRAAALLSTVPYASTASVALGWRREDVPHPLAGSGFVVARRYSHVRITACTWVSSKWDGRAPADHVLLRAFLGGVHDPAVVDLPDDAMAALAVRDLSDTLGITAPPMLVRVFRARRAGAQHTVGHRARMAELGARLRTLPGLFVAGSGVNAIGIPDCVEHGRRVAAAAAEYVGGRRQ